MAVTNPNPETVCVGRGRYVPCCPNEMSETLTATITNNADCADIDAKTIDLAWNGTSWVGEITGPCSKKIEMDLSCVLEVEEWKWQLAVTCDGNSIGNDVATSPACDPLDLLFVGLIGTTDCCCSSDFGVFDVTVTE